MAENRMPRSTESRNQTQRPQQWAPPELLPEPDKQPGYKYRWIRVTLGGQSDARNISTKRISTCRISDFDVTRILSTSAQRRCVQFQQDDVSCDRQCHPHFVLSYLIVDAYPGITIPRVV